MCAISSKNGITNIFYKFPKHTMIWCALTRARTIAMSLSCVILIYTQTFHDYYYSKIAELKTENRSPYLYSELSETST